MQAGGPQHGGYEHDVAFERYLLRMPSRLRKQRSLGITPSTDSSLKNWESGTIGLDISGADDASVRSSVLVRANGKALRETLSISSGGFIPPRPSPMPRVNWVNFPT